MPKVIICQTVAKSIHLLWLHRGGPFFFEKSDKGNRRKDKQSNCWSFDPEPSLLPVPSSKNPPIRRWWLNTRVLIGTLIHLFSSFPMSESVCLSWVRFRLASRQWGRNERSLASNPFHCVLLLSPPGSSCITMNDKDHRRRRTLSMKDQWPNPKGMPWTPEKKRIPSVSQYKG